VSVNRTHSFFIGGIMTRTEKFTLRLTHEEKRTFEQVAQLLNRSLSDAVRHIVIEVSKKLENATSSVHDFDVE
jgi:uncharacterized protein (DUF111 family)